MNIEIYEFCDDAVMNCLGWKEIDFFLESLFETNCYENIAAF